MDEKIIDLIKQNHEMKEILIQILQGEIPDGEWKTKRDSLGFTPLHYALMAKNEKIFKKMLKRQFRFGLKENYEQFLNIHDLVIISEYLGLEMADEIFLQVSYEAKIISMTISFEKAHLTVQEMGISGNKNLERVTRRKLKNAQKERNYLAYTEAENLLRKIYTNRIDLEKGLYEIKDNLRELDEELEVLVSKNRIERRKKLEEFVKSQEQYIVKIREILLNPRKLLNILEMEAPLYTMIYWKNILLAIPKTWICDMKDAFETSFKQKTQKEKTIQKPYGDSWFSPEAHESRSVLKSEFRELAKEYHPDHYSGLESVSITKVFQEILGERMMILQSFG